MTQTAQAKKTEKTAPVTPKPVSGRGLARRRGLGSNHTVLASMAGSWERQADQAADRVLRGEHGVAHLLASAPAAGFTLPTSRGEELPVSLRQELETGFGADLSAVRVHRDAPAAGAAQLHHARAFASGRDIYIGAGVSDLTTPSGKRLLAHEVAHVLQQTGGAKVDGVVQTVNTAGIGSVQFQLEDETLNEMVLRRSISFLSLSAAHRSAGVDEYLEKVITLASEDLKDMGGNFGDGWSAVASAFEKKVFAKGSEYALPLQSSGPARSFIYECLKFSGCFKGAARLLAMDLNIKITYPFLPVATTYIEQYERAFFLDVVEQHPVLKAYWPDRFLRTYRTYLYGPTRAIPTWSVSGKSFETAEKEFIESYKTETLWNNELFAWVFIVLKELDDERIKSLYEMKAALDRYFEGSKDDVAVHWRRLLALKVQECGQNLIDTAEWDLFMSLGYELEAMGAEAFAFWTQVIQTQKMVFDPDLELGEHELLVPNDPFFTQDIPKCLMEASELQFAMRDYTDFPSANVYGGQVAGAKKKLKDFALNKLELPIISTVEEDPSQARLMAVFLTFFLGYIQRLDEYSVAKDKEFAKAYANRPDIRVAHRLECANALVVLISRLPGATQFVDWGLLQALADDVLINADQMHSTLALVSDWEPQPDKAMGAMEDDFKDGVVLPGAVGAAVDPSKLSIFHLVKLLKILYYKALTGELQKLLAAPEETDLAKAFQQKPILNQAFEKINASTRPVRWHVPMAGVFFATNPEATQYIKDPDSGMISELSNNEEFAFLIRNHPKTIQTVTMERANGRDVLFPLRNPNEVFFWTLPDFNLVIQPLRGDDINLNEDIATLSGKTVDEVKLMTDEVWLENLALVDTDLLDYALDIYDSGWQEQAYAGLEEKIRLAVRRERNYLSKVFRKAMATYTGHADDTWSLPDKMLEMLKRFSDWALPKEDQKAHVAAVMLENADVLLEVLEDEERYDVITQYYGLVVLGIIYAGSEKESELLRVCDTPEEVAALQAKKPLLETLRTALDEVRKGSQNRFGFESDGKQLKSFVYSNTIKPKDAFQIDGVPYKLVAVHAKFKYNPAYGQNPGEGAQEGEGGYNPPLMDGKAYGEEYIPTGKKLFTINISDTQQVVTDKDIDLLDLFSHVVEMRACVIGLENLAEGIETYMNTLMDVVELVPGFGQGFAAARMVTTIAQFLMSGEFEDIKRVLNSEPEEIIAKMIEEIKGACTVENVLEFLLFGSPLFDFLKKFAGSPSMKRVSVTKKTGAFAGVVSSIRNIRAGFARRLEMLQEKVQVPMRAFQAKVLARPRLSSGLRLVADNIYRLDDWLKELKKIKELEERIAASYEAEKEKKPELVKDPQSMLGTILQDLAGSNSTLTENVQSVLDGINGISVPERVIPNVSIVDVILEMILKRLGTKGKLTNEVLELLGIRQEISGMIADAIKDTSADPNVYWKDNIVPLLNEQLVPVKQAMVDAVFSVLTDAPLSLSLTPPTAGQDYQPEFEAGEAFEAEEDFPETEGLLDGPVLGRPSITATSESGTSLPRSLRSEAEWKFGHDFGHVRLHTGSSARQLTHAWGAQALASGSHVFLRPDVSLSHRAGRGVLHHELTHVLQQTGPRPLTQAHSDRSVWGHPERGLVFNPEREHTAETMAQSNSQVGGRVLNVSGMGAHGFEPKPLIGYSTIRRILNDLTNLELVEQLQTSVDEQVEKKAIIDVEPEDKAKAEALWDAVWLRLKSPATGDCPSHPHLVGALTEFTTYVTSHHAAVTKAIPYLANRALLTRRKKKTADKKPTFEKELNAEGFAGLLQAYLMAKTGVVTLIKVASKEDATLKSFQITNLLMGEIGSNSGLWTLALSHSNLHGKSVEEMRPMLRSLLQSAKTALSLSEPNVKGDTVTLTLWKSTVFGFHDELTKHAQEKIDAIATAGEPSNVPKAAHYKNTLADIKPADGLQVATHGKLTKRGSPSRQSHHTTQFLLLDYFRNRKGDATLPFPTSGGLKSAWTAVGVEWETAKMPKAVGEINLAKLDSGGRADDMPAIYLATPVHQTAGLHIDKNVMDDSPTSSATQGNTVHKWFCGYFYTGTLSDLENKPSELATALNADPSTFSTKLSDAVQATYKEMYKHMMPALQKGLEVSELAYYNRIAAKNTVQKDGETILDPDYYLSVGDMTDVYTKAKTNNDEIMTSAGWKTPDV